MYVIVLVDIPERQELDISAEAGFSFSLRLVSFRPVKPACHLRRLDAEHESVDVQ